MCAAAISTAAAASAPHCEELLSPDGNLRAEFLLLDGGVPAYTLSYHGKTVIDTSRLGFKLSDSGLYDWFEIYGTERASIDETWHPVWGDESSIRNRCNEMAVTLMELGCPIAATHHETSPGQHEIDFGEQEGLTCADTLVTAKSVMRIVARRAGFHATFMPKPKMGVNGSGLHLPISLYDKEGRNFFYDPEDAHGISESARSFMAGVLSHVEGMSLVLNPLVNSYKRIVPGYDAPVDISWTAGTNRGSLLRVPSGYGKGMQLELRSPDPACNPYLAFALILSAGLWGLSGKGSLPPEGKSLGSLPVNLGQAIDAYRNDSLVKEVLSEPLYEKYLEAKIREYDLYKRQITPWEVEEYLHKY